MSAERSAVTAGVDIGFILALAISWSINESILWALAHGFFGWLYVAYFVVWVR